MTNNFRLGAAAVFLVLAVLVDFAGRVMSVVADAALVGVAVYVLMPLFKNTLANGKK